MSIKGYRRLIVCGVVLLSALGSAAFGWLESGDLSSVMLGIVGGFAAPDAVEKFKGAPS